MRVAPRPLAACPWYLADRAVDDEVVARLRAHLDEDAIVELTALIAFQNMSSRLNAALDVPPQGFCKVPLPEPGRATGDGPREDLAVGRAGRRDVEAAQPGGTGP